MAKNTRLPVIPTRNPFHKFIDKKRLLPLKCQKVENVQLEKLEKQTEEEILKIARNFCERVRTWDEEDSTVRDSLRHFSVVESTGDETRKIVSINADLKSGPASTTEEEEKKKKLLGMKDFSHLTDPYWVSKLFQIHFKTLLPQGYSRKMRETLPKEVTCEALEVEMDVEQIEQMERLEWLHRGESIRKKARCIDVAFGRNVKRARGLEDWVVCYKKNKEAGVEKSSPLKDPDELASMSAVWGEQQQTYATRVYCKHLRDLIRKKIRGPAEWEEGTEELADAQGLTLSQMQPMVLKKTGMLAINFKDKILITTSSSSSSSTTPS